MNLLNSFCTQFLSSYTLLEYSSKENFEEKIHILLFNEMKKEYEIVPNYVLKNVQYELKSKESLRELLNFSLEKLSDVLFVRDERLYAYEESFQQWQYDIKIVSPLILISYFIYQKDLSEGFIKQFEYSVLPSIYKKKLEYILTNNKIVDTHIHLNGTTEADVIWQDILKYPKKFLSEVQNSFKDELVQEQFSFLGSELDFDSFARMVYEAIKLKKELSDKITINKSNSLVGEIEFFIKIFGYINRTKSIKITKQLWRYISIYNLIHKFLVQQQNQIGFEEFQKITLNGFREYTEKEYQKRFEQIRSIYKDDVVLEGRFAPKIDAKRLVLLLESILSCKSENKDSLSLVCHFIKKEDKRDFDELYSYRDMPLRKELSKVCEQLLYIVKNNLEFKNAIKGFDVAGNELYARPEVFSSLFKVLRKNGYENFTFHGGEDFVELTSGIRYVYEIAEFLDFKDSNRIGHATALGIEPKLWKKRIGKQIIIKQGEYLDNLVFVYMILNQSNNYLKSKNKILNKINELSQKVYQKEVSITILIEAWKMRKEDPAEVLGWSESCENFDKKYSLEAIKIFTMYHSDTDTLKAYESFITISTDFLSNKVLIFLQDYTTELLNNKNIVIETMISSNVNISFYKNYDEHHILRWLGIEKYKSSPKPTLVLATDDPGIFATNMRNEIAHLYLMLKNKKVEEEEIFRLIEVLLRNGEVYGF